MAQVGVFGAVENGFVELAHLVERLTAYHLAGTYHIVGLDGALVVGTKLLGGRAQSQYAQQFALERGKRTEAALHVALDIGQAAGTQPHLGVALEIGHHAVDGACGGDGVVVEDEQRGGSGLGDALVARRSHATVHGVDGEVDQGVGLGDVLRGAIGRRIVDDDDLGIAALHHRLERRQAAPRVVEVVVGEDDDREFFHSQVFEVNRRV